MSESPQERLEADLKTAMKARDRTRVETLRMLLTAVKNRRIEVGDELNEEHFVAEVRRAVKQRKESASVYRQGGRVELAEKEEAEIALLEPYLPAQVDEDTIRQAAAEYMRDEGLAGMQAMGQVMKAMIARFGPSADGKTISGVVRQLLGDS